MRNIRIPPALAPTAVFALAALAAPAHAAVAAAPLPDSIVGIYAAVGCGIGIRASIISGGYPLVVVLTVGLCAVMAIDAIITPD